MSFTNLCKDLLVTKPLLGELAHWISQDQHFPKYERISDNILSYFTKITTLDHEFLEVVKRSISLYEQSQL